MVETFTLIWFNGVFIKNVVYAVCFHIPASNGINKYDNCFVWACWIHRMYAYKVVESRVDEVAYFGIPKTIQLDGMKPDRDLWQSTKKLEREPDPDCRPMQKTFYLQV